MLMERQKTKGDSTKYLVPVPGLVSDNLPTTGNVHLYTDTGTYYSQKPILYADCEGMTGGESIPMGLDIASEDMAAEDLDSEDKDSETAAQNIDGVRQSITWADNPDLVSRANVAKTLFPRVLYTFSDVVVFVLREAR